MIVVKAEINALEHIVLDQGHYIIPRKDGQLLIGSTMEDVGSTIICPLIGNILLSLSNKDELQAPPQTIVLFV
jgi:glycine/D-amino acid oxidase-like deaminating enzyme